MQTLNFDDVPVLWKPSPERGKHLKSFIKLISEKYNTKLNDFWDLHKWTVEHLEEFWAEIWDMTGIIYSKKYEKVVDLTVSLSDIPRWFTGAKLNYAENLLRYRDEHVAMILAGEERQVERITYSTMYKEVERYAAAFRNLGLKKNDVVVCFMSNRVEPVYAMIAVTSIGAIWTGALPLMGAQAVLNRFQQVKPKFMITIDRFLYNQQEIEMLSKVEVIAKGLPTLEKVIIVPSKEQSKTKDISKIPNSCFVDEFLRLGMNPDGSVPQMKFEQVSFSHPVFICYTSGTTGLPKPILHASGGLLSVIRDRLNRDGDRDFMTLSVSPVGWASWNMFCTMFFAGARLLLYDGVPFYLSPTYLWDLVDEVGVSNIFMAPSIMDELEKRNYVPGHQHHLNSLAAIFSGGSVVKLQNFDFVFNKIKKNILFSSAYGCTEVFGGTLVTDLSLPIRRGEIPCPSLGVDVQVINESGESVIGEVGDLAFLSPMPMMTVGLWNDPDGTLFKEMYYSKYSDKFTPGDVAVVNPNTRGYILFGRSDETLKPKGCRFGSSEIYHIVNIFPEIRDSLCVSQYNASFNERAVLFLQMREGHVFNEDLLARVRKAIEQELSIRHVPELILQTSAVPYNMNGKKMEILVKKIINNRPYNAETVINKDSLKNFENVPPYDD